MRKEEIPVLLKTSRPWDGISVEELSTTYAKMLPDYNQFTKLMESVVCMFDSFAIPQGRKVINYYYPLQYGLDGIIALCDERITETLGEPHGDGILRIFYRPMANLYGANH